MPKVLFFANNQHLLDDLRHRLANEQIESTAASYTDLEFTLDGDDSSIKLRSTGEDLSNFDVIINISTPAHKLIHIYSSLACYCRKKGIKIIDDNFTNTSGKLYEMWRLWEKGVPVPKTAFGDISHLSRKLIDFGGVGVLKVTHGAKGKENYLVHSTDEIAQILSDKSPYDYILQNFIPNTGDYRVVAFDYEPKLAIHRSASGTDHRNNTSLGAQANVVEITTELAQIARAAAEALDINRTPQFASGSFLNEKYASLRDYLRSLNI